MKNIGKIPCETQRKKQFFALLSEQRISHSLKVGHQSRQKMEVAVYEFSNTGKATSEDKGVNSPERKSGKYVLQKFVFHDGYDRLELAFTLPNVV